ncbi:hypothetical protein M8J76_004528 [Diaphorina citri]|nr:hypothetical protein M8J75_002747 [Diaphorina citri]KAI5744705.1 hypothetical protein M8J76_004528 [Diaphorina citri]KAI5752606.1 hypothetical protein M8J77_018557 [Diaphorina citri]QPZ88902.1 chemosensory protein 3 [Diaphorina citri]
MSRLLVCISTISLIVCAVSLVSAQKKQAESAPESGILDNFDVDSVLNNGRVLKNYVKCVLNMGPCTAEGREMKRVLPDVLKTACGKCSEQHKERLRKVLLKLKNDPKLKEDYNKIIEKYDPKKEYVANLEKFLLS